jgi:UDP-glucuronate 4-epimerase
VSEERFLVTGALGCIGAWTVRTLVREGAAVTGFDLGTDPRRLRLIMTPDELARVELESGDIGDLDALEGVIDRHRITNVIHLAALQVPFCRADPPGGARVNVLGTVNVFEAVKRRAARMGPVVYTSSIAVFADDDADPASGRLTVDATGHPRTHYGVYKLANEGSARVYWLEDGVPSIGVRPMTVYGVGRDQGMTSGPTKAIVAAVLGLPYTVAFSGATLYQYAEDVARTLLAASRSRVPGAHVFNLPGTVADGPGLSAAIEAAVPGSSGAIAFEPGSLPFPSEIDHDGIEALGPLPVTPFADGVRASVDIYRDLAAQGRLDPSEHGLDARGARP